MIAGYPPFFSANPFAVYQQILKNKITFPSIFKSDARSIVSSFLNTSRSRRLGCTMGGFGTIENHPFFKGVSWESARKLQLQPILIPTCTSDGDTSNFDFYAEETLEITSNLTLEQRILFRSYDEVLSRPSQI